MTSPASANDEAPPAHRCDLRGRRDIDGEEAGHVAQTAFTQRMELVQCNLVAYLDWHGCAVNQQVSRLVQLVTAGTTNTAMAK